MIVYKVKKDETLAIVAKKFNLSVESIKHDNNWSGEVFEGARLLIRESGKLHKVKPFEKISDIAKLYDISLSCLMNANFLSKPYVFAGQTLIIPENNG